MTTTHPTPALVLVPGHWLGGWAWDAVASNLCNRGHHVTALTLPGLDPADPDRLSRTLDEQADALRSAVVAAGSPGVPVVVVAHSGAGAPTSLLLDKDPDLVSRVIYVDSGPSANLSAFDSSLSPDIDEVPLPPFDELLASIEGIAANDLARFRKRAVSEPGEILRASVNLTNDLRRDVPTTIIASSYPSEVVMQMAREGHPMMAEVAALRNLHLVDLPTGHWPMWSRPAELADTISTAAHR